MSRLHINSAGLDLVIKELREFSTSGVQRAQDALDRSLDRTAEVSRELAHEHSGALKASQSHSSDHGPNHWQGSIAYSAPGGEWEMAEGGEHSAFIDRLAGLSEADFRDAVDQAFRNLG